MLDIVKEEVYLASAILVKEDIIGVLKYLITEYHIEPENIIILDNKGSLYDRYYLTLDSDLTIEIKPVYDEKSDTISVCESDILLIDGLDESKILISNDDCKQMIIYIDDRYDIDYTAQKTQKWSAVNKFLYNL